MTDFQGLLRALTEGQVRFIIVGGVAAGVLGSARGTKDLGVVYARTPENIRALVAALSDLRPYLRGAPPGLPFVFEAETVRRGLNFTLTTSLGSLDLLGEMTGGGGYDDLLSGADTVDLFGLSCRCLSLDQLIRAKRAAGRPHDLLTAAELEIIRDLRGPRPPSP